MPEKKDKNPSFLMYRNKPPSLREYYLLWKNERQICCDDANPGAETI